MTYALKSNTFYGIFIGCLSYKSLIFSEEYLKDFLLNCLQESQDNTLRNSLEEKFLKILNLLLEETLLLDVF